MGVALAVDNNKLALWIITFVDA